MCCVLEFYSMTIYAKKKRTTQQQIPFDPVVSLKTGKQQE